MDNTLALCVPAFNAAEYLPRLFESVRRQTVPFDEVLVYDDASSDDTARVAAAHGARVVHGVENVGCSAGKNALLAEISSSWVHFHDADDVLGPEYVERAKRRIAANDFDVLLFDYEQVDAATGVQMYRSEFAATSVLEHPVRYMLANTVINAGVYSVAFLRDVGGFDVDRSVLYNEDRAFHLRLAQAGAQFAVESYVGTQLFFTRSSMSQANRARCCLANHFVTARFASQHPGLYSMEVGARSWDNAACLASCLDWKSVDACIKLAITSTGRTPPHAGAIFKTLCIVSPYFATRVREAAIRVFKRPLRMGYPAWNLSIKSRPRGDRART